MIEAEQFVESARSLGYDMYTGVPCSFLTPFINYVLDRDDLCYVISANEGDAVATAAGAVLGGRRAERHADGAVDSRAGGDGLPDR